MSAAVVAGAERRELMDAGSSPPADELPGQPGWTGRARSAGRWLGYAVGQALLLAGLFMAYRYGRQLAIGHESVAFEHARDVWNLQQALGLPSEEAVQRLALRSTTLVELANRFYMYVHFPATVVFLAWVLLRHRDHWARVRNALIVLTGAALVLHLTYPLAPPRFLPRLLPGVDIVDTGQLIGPSPYPSEGGSLNQYAAMPSLHVGWAIFEAWAVVMILRSRARWAALAQPVVTTLVVVLTGNHYWLDGIVGGALVAAAVWVTAPGRVGQLRARLTGLPSSELAVPETVRPPGGTVRSRR
ncbi:inositol phosphorylceramide synthase [Frankia sp. CNm7]|uniref:Inositol phosphorylceramide synthase n=1 Tax=Frankia nepalensis TaxID=1836974 RepID=A0A937RL93_9ACTN|nr:phosphatase PAP2 family protein [Frankia nepalensis]MBL7501434.1 inositol phosphorylceramide synthase [Frankia nepalensis]MBL7510003.1 inositol phosphorylceramide synthase [Frankia nepalensis]MBL7517147.1 inositol phosphorylceramide synthase [Frankia nepalensis]MBL7627986.1 inositol phosphorylceramide synthase [Frankia nepalensis]